MMKYCFTTFLFVLFTIAVQAQKVKWQDVEVREFTQRYSEKDSSITGKVVAEWFEPGEAGSLAELSAAELKSIKKKAAKKGCNLVYVDVKGVYTKRKGDLYVLGLRRVIHHGAITD